MDSKKLTVQSLFLQTWPMRMSLPLIALLVTAAGPSDIAVTVNGIRSTSGTLIICVMPDRSAFPACAKQGRATKLRLEVTDATMRARVAVPAGTYAITAFHDEDGDGKLKTNFIGIPREGVGVSGKAGGIPSFDKAAIPVKPGTGVTLTMRYL
jgi:uncharacterized protein (DUF2141 family)